MLPALNLKIIIAVISVAVLVAGYFYIQNLRTELKISQMNEEKLQNAISQQSELLKQKTEEIISIQEINKELSETINLQTQEVQALKDKFTVTKTGKKRDLGYLARAKTDRIQRLVNEGTAKVLNCFEKITKKKEVKDACK